MDNSILRQHLKVSHLACQSSLWTRLIAEHRVSWVIIQLLVALGTGQLLDRDDKETMGQAMLSKSLYPALLHSRAASRRKLSISIRFTCNSAEVYFLSVPLLKNHSFIVKLAYLPK